MFSALIRKASNCAEQVQAVVLYLEKILVLKSTFRLIAGCRTRILLGLGFIENLFNGYNSRVFQGVSKAFYVYSSADESIKDETRLLLLWVSSLVTLYTFVFTHMTYVVKPVHIFMAKSRVSKSRLKPELCFHRYVYFSCVPIYTYIYIHIYKLIYRNIYRNFIRFFSWKYWKCRKMPYVQVKQKNAKI